MFAIINVKTGKLFNGKTFDNLFDAEEALEDLDYGSPALSPAFDLFELTENGWKPVDCDWIMTVKPIPGEYTGKQLSEMVYAHSNCADELGFEVK